MRGPCTVGLVDGLIANVQDGWTEAGGSSAMSAGADPTIFDLPPHAILAPGFIDVQVNGGGGRMLNDGPSCETIRIIAAAHRRFGTTGFLPTLITDEPARMHALADVGDDAMALPGVLGLHLEGPFLNPARKGIHPAAFLRMPHADDMAVLLRFGRFGRSLVTLAPELFDPSVLRCLAGSGLRLSIGHSEATSAQLQQAAAAGVTGVTHLFNAMSQMQPRAPGVVGSALAHDALFAGIICDGHHVDPVNLRAAFRAKGRDRLMLVTDAMATVGARQGGFTLNGRSITLEAGRLQDAHGTLAGAHLTMIDAVQNAVEMMGATLGDALIMASATPARFLGLDGARGRIAPGFQADLVAFDGRRVIQTWIDGHAATQNSHSATDDKSVEHCHCDDAQAPYVP